MATKQIVATLVLAVTPLFAFALGLGEIQVSSSLNEPFAATIPVIGAGELQNGELLVKLAAEADFQRAGISKDAVLLDLKFTPKLNENPAVIAVSSDKPIREPFLDFILDVQSPKAQLMKEYTVMLSPKP